MCSLRENIHEIVTVHSVHSNVAKIHSRLPAAMEFWLETEHGILYKYVRKQSRVPLSPQRI